MGLIELLIVLVVVGVVLWLVESAPFIDAGMKPIIRWVVIAVVVLWMLSVFVGDLPLPSLRRR